MTKEEIFNYFLTNSANFGTESILFSMLAGVCISILIYITYYITYRGVNYNSKFNNSLIVISLISNVIMQMISINIAISLGMVGALSIVRFRTAVKDPVDTIFMFWAITAGIMSGAGLYIATLIATIIIGLFYFLCCTYQSKSKTKQLLVIKSSVVESEKIIELMKKKSKCSLKTESYKNNIAELTYEIANRELAEEILKMKNDEGIISINLLEIQ